MTTEEQIMLFASMRIMLDRFSFIKAEVDKIEESMQHLANDLEVWERQLQDRVDGFKPAS